MMYVVSVADFSSAGKADFFSGYSEQTVLFLPNLERTTQGKCGLSHQVIA